MCDLNWHSTTVCMSVNVHVYNVNVYMQHTYNGLLLKPFFL